MLDLLFVFGQMLSVLALLAGFGLVAWHLWMERGERNDSRRQSAPKLHLRGHLE